MKCPKCGGKSIVIDVRKVAYGVRRRRSCKECGCLFSSVEVRIEEYSALVRFKRAIREAIVNLKARDGACEK